MVKREEEKKWRTCVQVEVKTFPPSASLIVRSSASPSSTLSDCLSAVVPIASAPATPLVFVAPPFFFVVDFAFSLIQFRLRSTVVAPYIPPVCMLKLAPSLSETGR